MKTAEKIFKKQNPQDGTLPEWAKRLAKEYAKQLLEEYNDRIVENSKNWRDLSGGVYKKVDKESITSQLAKYLKEIGL